MTLAPHPKQLLVEGNDDKRIIPEFIEQMGIPWSEGGGHLVEIFACGNVDKLLDRDSLRATTNATGLSTLGILFDANDKRDARWESLRDTFKPVAKLPAQPPPKGFIGKAKNGIRIGIWLLPDNVSNGMMETFLAGLIPAGHSRLWDYTNDVVTSARDQGAPWKNAHKDKARVHTWLAWQDPPGPQLHTAVLAKLFDLQGRKATTFFNWFTKLYELNRPTQ